MSLAERPPPAGGLDVRRWADRLNDYLVRTKSRLVFYVAGDSPVDDGIILWDREGYPVISKDNQWRQIVLADGYGEIACTTSQVATSADTAYQIPFNSTSTNGGISVNASDNTRIDFVEAGVYSITGHIQIKSSSAASKTVYYWLSVNGTNVDHSERLTVHNNNAFSLLAVTDQVELNAGDYIQFNYAVDDVNLWLDASAATAFAPASEAARISITRSRQ
ncbi:MAG: hypothetical protein CMJ25_24395 [Phycisphaerae bacterium]|nr:hypothetical protein [Phycisphaerae bacterium]|tara:strand:+ start:224 stop:883 length:660 start_codon:yes stop_codon:yes gene_type:complete